MIKDFMNESNISNERIKYSEMQSAGKKTGLIISAIALSVLIFAAAGCTGGGSSDVPEVPPEAPSAPIAEPSGNAGSAAAPAGEDIMVEPGSAATPEASKTAAAKEEEVDVIAGANDKMVTMVVEDTGRQNPFQPRNEVQQKDENKNQIDFQSAKLKFDLVDPPAASQSDSDAEKVLTTKVSGIMYDAESPSSIINIEGTDYLVRSGDVVNGYKVLAITPSVVTVQLGSNIYKAGVGELLVTDGIQYNTISNLSNKFGGAKKQVK